MALNKARDLQNGIIGTYWRVISIQIERQNTTLIVELWLDAATRMIANKKPLGHFSWTMPTPTPAQMDSLNPYKLAYAYLKSKEDFSGAQDA